MALFCVLEQVIRASPSSTCSVAYFELDTLDCWHSIGIYGTYFKIKNSTNLDIALLEFVRFDHLEGYFEICSKSKSCPHWQTSQLFHLNS